MKSNQFMLGNLVALCDNYEADSIIAIEESVLHLSKRKLPDDERDIEGVPLTGWINGQTKGLTKGKIIIAIKGVMLEFTVKRSNRKAILLLSINRYSTHIILTYMHELQNLVFILTGQKLDTDQQWDITVHNANLPIIE